MGAIPGGPVSVDRPCQNAAEKISHSFPGSRHVRVARRKSGELSQF